MRELMFFLLRATGVPFLLRLLYQRNAVTILCYHDPRPEVFARHLEVLGRRYRFTSLRHYVEWRLGRGPAPPSYALIITFDDGHRGNVRLAKVLADYSLTATIFLCTGIAGTNRRFWWNTVSNESARESLKAVLDSDRMARLRALGFEEMAEVEKREALSDEEIELLRPIVDFQAHTRFHPVLPRCSDERALSEIEGARRDIQERFGTVAFAMAYPNGDYSDREIAYARKAGYLCALTLDGGYNNGETDLLALHRMPLEDSAGPNEVLVKASGLWDFLRRVFGRRPYGYSRMTGARGNV